MVHWTIFSSAKKNSRNGSFLLPMTGLEPAPDCSEQILNLPRLPFRHIGIDIRKRLEKTPKKGKDCYFLALVGLAVGLGAGGSSQGYLARWRCLGASTVKWYSSWLRKIYSPMAFCLRIRSSSDCSILAQAARKRGKMRDKTFVILSISYNPQLGTSSQFRG